MVVIMLVVLKPGGPYEVSVQSSAYSSETTAGITLIVGDTKRLNFVLESIDEVVVVASAGTALRYRLWFWHSS